MTVQKKLSTKKVRLILKNVQFLFVAEIKGHLLKVKWWQEIIILLAYKECNCESAKQGFL